MSKEDYVVICGDFGGVWAADRFRVQEPPAEKCSLDWLEEKAEDGSARTSAGSRFVTKQIRVYFAEETVPIYTLDSGDFKEQA